MSNLEKVSSNKVEYEKSSAELHPLAASGFDQSGDDPANTVNHTLSSRLSS